MRFGARAYALEDLGRIARAGLEFAEISLLRGGDLVHRVEALQREAKSCRLTYLVHAPNEGDPCDVERLQGRFFGEILDLLDACRVLAAPILTMHFWMDGRCVPGHVAERKREILAEMARAGAEKGVQVCLENLSERPQDLDDLFHACPQIGLTLDIGHGQLFSKRNRALEFVKRWPERILHLHVHDNRGGEGVKDDIHLPIGDGIIDYPAIFSALLEANYTGRICMEVPVEHLERSLVRLREIIEPLTKGG